MKIVGSALLFLMAWPIFVIVWWVKPDTRPTIVQQIVNFTRSHPRLCAWFGVGFGLTGGIGNLTGTAYGAGFTGLGIAAGCGFLLLRWRIQERAARNAEIAARADAQHRAYLEGDDFGLYGTREMPL
ncbi:hypothetical protein [Nocardia transvalensis]|uniref:hypothetical protein n=1 Tax=Nocardia transvalensis TaxID=37333 RepID=UPI001895B37E|nr:hypothetical protein [Nocardia transvalensis]MBF6332396.1 hypothetical protein [Nocardia transvalensis]